MDAKKSLEALNNISQTVNVRDKKIWENEAQIKFMENDIERLEKEITEFKCNIEELEKEDLIVESQSEQLTKSMKLQMETLRISEKSLDNQKLDMRRSLEFSESYKLKYAKLIEEGNKELQLKRNRLKANSNLYKELELERLELKKIKIKTLELEAKIVNNEEIKKQFNQIQKQIFTTNVVQFAKIFLEHKKRYDCYLTLKQAEAKEKQCMRKYLELQETVKKYKANKSMKKITSGLERPKLEFHKIDIEQFNQINFNTNPPAALHLPKSSLLTKQLKSQNVAKFINPPNPMPKEIKSTSTSTAAPQEKLFNADKSKLRILDVKSFKPEDKAVKAPNADLIKKLENIVQSTKNASIRKNSFVIPQQCAKKPRLINENKVLLSQKSPEDYNASDDVPTTVSQELKQLNLNQANLEADKKLLTQANKENIEINPPNPQFMLRKSSLNFKVATPQQTFSFPSQKQGIEDSNQHDFGQTSKCFIEGEQNIEVPRNIMSQNVGNIVAELMKPAEEQNCSKNLEQAVNDDGKGNNIKSADGVKVDDEEIKSTKKQMVSFPSSQMFLQQAEYFFQPELTNTFNFENFSNRLNPSGSPNTFNSGQSAAGDEFVYSDDPLFEASTNVNYTAPSPNEIPNQSSAVDTLFSFGQPSKNVFMF